MRGSAAELAERYADAPPKGEVVLVFGPPSPVEQGAGEPAGLDALRRLVEAGARPRAAAGVVAELTGGSANALYRALTTARGSATKTRLLSRLASAAARLPCRPAARARRAPCRRRSPPRPCDRVRTRRSRARAWRRTADPARAPRGRVPRRTTVSPFADALSMSTKIEAGADDGVTRRRARAGRLRARAPSRSPAGSPASTSLGKCQPSETTEKPTASASAAPTTAAAGRARRGAAKTAASASAMAAVECPLGSASTPTCPPPTIGCRRGYASSSLSSWLETLVRASSSTIRIATRGRPRGDRHACERERRSVRLGRGPRAAPPPA